MMNNTFTSKDLIRFIYKETSAKESIEIAEAIHEDWRLKEEYNLLLEAKKELPKVSFSPSNDVVSSILKHSATTSMETC